MYREIRENVSAAIYVYNSFIYLVVCAYFIFPKTRKDTSFSFMWIFLISSSTLNNTSVFDTKDASVCKYICI